MNIYFIHGVNKRRALTDAFAGVPEPAAAEDGYRNKYDQELEQLEQALRICAREAGFDGIKLIPIYWGNLGVRFHYYDRDPGPPQRYVPSVHSGPARCHVKWSKGQRPQGMGDAYVEPELQALAARLDSIAEANGVVGASLRDLLLAAPQAVLEGLLAPELASPAVGPETTGAVAAAAAGLCDRLSSDARLRERVLELSGDEDADAQLVRLLEEELAASHGARAQGALGWTMKSALRLALKPIVRKAQSSRAYLDVGRFIGDSVRYFSGRGTSNEPGQVITEIVKQVEQAGWPKPGAEPNVFITHSLGGAVFYDLFSYFRSDLRFDLWVSVGSQLAYYEDAKLLAHRIEPSFEPGAAARKVRAPLPDDAAWYNVFDVQDWLAFRAETVFENVKDWPHAFPVNEHLGRVHTAYFDTVSFYQALTRILRDRFQRSRDEVNWRRFFDAMRGLGVGS